MLNVLHEIICQHVCVNCYNLTSHQIRKFFPKCPVQQIKFIIQYKGRDSDICVFIRRLRKRECRRLYLALSSVSMH
jgi:hypothetical protein